MYCKECGVEVPDRARFCTNCGAKIESMPQSVANQSVGPRPPWDTDVMAVGVQQSLAPAVAPQQAPRSRKRSAGATIALAFLILVVGFVLQVAAYIFVAALKLPVKADTALVVVSAVASVVGIALLGGKRLIIPAKDAFVMAIKKGWWLIFTSLGLMGFELASAIMGGETVIEDGWPLRLLEIVILCVGIGLSEESSFRGLMFCSFLDAQGKSKKGLYVAAIVSSVLFGFAHIDWVGINYTDPLSLLQALLKTVQTGFLGFFFAALVLRSKSVLGAAFLHFLSDFLLLAPTTVLLNGSTDVNYVQTGEQAIATIILYLIFIALYIPMVISGKRMLDGATVPDYGPFHKA